MTFYPQKRPHSSSRITRDGPTDGRTDGRTEGRTDTTSYRDAESHQKRGEKGRDIFGFVTKFRIPSFCLIFCCCEYEMKKINKTEKKEEKQTNRTLPRFAPGNTVSISWKRDRKKTEDKN